MTATREDREAIAREIAARRGAVLVPPFDDALIIAGQGTAGREIVEDLDRARAYARRGGGHRVGRRAHRRHCACGEGARAEAALYTAEPQGFDDHARSFRSGQREHNAAHQRHDLRRADGAHAGAAHLRDQSIAGRRGRGRERRGGRGTRSLSPSRELKLVVEPGGAVALAALMTGKVDVARQDRRRRSFRRQCRSRIVFAAGGLEPRIRAWNR